MGMFEVSTNQRTYRPTMETLHLLEELIAIDSPTGYTDKASEYIASVMEGLGWNVRRTVKGAVVASNGSDPKIGLAAHTDTLGAIVSKVRPDGTLAFSLLGAPLLHTFEGSYVRIHTMDGKMYHGTILLNDPSTHANRHALSSERTIDTMHIRVDEHIKSGEDVEKLGIRVGDIIAVDPKYHALENGFIKSHFLDNKAGCYVLFEVARRLNAVKNAPSVELFFSTYEEVGHGGSAGFSSTLEELLVIDMGVVGAAVDGHETVCSICAKDSSGPYDYAFRKALVQVADKHKIPYSLDVYPFYGSDGSAALRAGLDCRVALIGPGVAASHGMERAHVDGVSATVDLCVEYLKQS